MTKLKSTRGFEIKTALFVHINRRPSSFRRGRAGPKLESFLRCQVAVSSILTADAAWGPGGRAALDVSGLTASAYLRFLLDREGRLIVYGRMQDFGAKSAFAARMVTGAIDATWGAGGLLQIAIDPTVAFGSFAAADGTLLVVQNSSSLDTKARWVRLDANGAAIDFAPGQPVKSFSGVTRQARDAGSKLMTKRESSDGFSATKELVERWLPGGSLDASYGSAGAVDVRKIVTAPEQLLTSTAFCISGAVMIATAEEGSSETFTWRLRRLAK